MAIAATHPLIMQIILLVVLAITANGINLHGNVIALSVVIGVAQPMPQLINLLLLHPLAFLGVVFHHWKSLWLQPYTFGI